MQYTFFNKGFKMDIKSKIKTLRNSKNLTQEQLAKRLWLSKASISAYESGTKYPSLEIIIKMARIFNVSTDYLLGIDKRQVIDVTYLSENQINIINNLIEEFNNKH